MAEISYDVLGIGNAIVDVLAPAEDGTEGADGSPAFVWDVLRETLESMLGRTTIATLCREAARRGVERAEAEPAMYHI